MHTATSCAHDALNKPFIIAFHKYDDYIKSPFIVSPLDSFMKLKAVCIAVSNLYLDRKISNGDEK